VLRGHFRTKTISAEGRKIVRHDFCLSTYSTWENPKDFIPGRLLTHTISSPACCPSTPSSSHINGRQNHHPRGAPCQQVARQVLHPHSRQRSVAQLSELANHGPCFSHLTTYFPKFHDTVYDVTKFMDEVCLSKRFWNGICRTDHSY